MLTELAKWSIADWFGVIAALVWSVATMLTWMHEEYKRGVRDGARQMNDLYMGQFKAGTLKACDPDDN